MRAFVDCRPGYRPRIVGTLEKPRSRPSLTQREREIVAAMMTAATNGDIARQLGIGEQSVKNRLTALYQKLGIRNRVELVLLMKTDEWVL